MIVAEAMERGGDGLGLVARSVERQVVYWSTRSMLKRIYEGESMGGLRRGVDERVVWGWDSRGEQRRWPHDQQMGGGER